MPEGENSTYDAFSDPLRGITTRGSVIFVRTIAVSVLLFLVWAGTSKVDRVTRGEGRVVSEERNSLVQHFEGGIITQILVEEGVQVKTGDVLMRIENSFAKAELDSSRHALLTQQILRTRLIAEAKGEDEVVFSPVLSDAAPDQVAQQTRLFDRRASERVEALSIIDDQVEQKELVASERKSRLENKRRERQLMEERLKSLRKLSEDGAVARNELLQNETQFQQLLTEISDLEHQVLQTESSLSEVRARRREAAFAFQAEAERELTETEFEIAKLDDTIAALRDRNLRFDVKAPTDGTINKLFFSTVNGVVRPGQNLAEIVPDDAPIAVEAKIRPSDRAKVHPGLESIIKVSAYDFTQYGGLTGRVIDVSPDALRDEDGSVYFRVRIEAPASGLGDGNPVVPGMMAEVDIISGQQTILDYFLRPVRTIGARAFRE